MKRIALVAGLLLTAVALAGVLRPEGAAAVEAPDGVDTVTVGGTGVVTTVPDRAPISAGVESRAPTARAALAANATAMRKVLDALRASGGKELTTRRSRSPPHSTRTASRTGSSPRTSRRPRRASPVLAR